MKDVLKRKRLIKSKFLSYPCFFDNSILVVGIGNTGLEQASGDCCLISKSNLCQLRILDTNNK